MLRRFNGQVSRICGVVIRSDFITKKLFLGGSIIQKLLFGVVKWAKNRPIKLIFSNVFKTIILLWCWEFISFWHHLIEWEGKKGQKLPKIGSDWALLRCFTFGILNHVRLLNVIKETYYLSGQIQVLSF